MLDPSSFFPMASRARVERDDRQVRSTTKEERTWNRCCWMLPAIAARRARCRAITKDEPRGTKAPLPGRSAHDRGDRRRHARRWRRSGRRTAVCPDRDAVARRAPDQRGTRPCRNGSRPLASNSDGSPRKRVFVAGSPRTNCGTRTRSRWPTRVSHWSSSNANSAMPISGSHRFTSRASTARRSSPPSTQDPRP
jgi:hypothetical protein